jgi:hypothetical protein
MIVEMFSRVFKYFEQVTEDADAVLTHSFPNITASDVALTTNQYIEMEGQCKRQRCISFDGEVVARVLSMHTSI